MPVLVVRGGRVHDDWLRAGTPAPATAVRLAARHRCASPAWRQLRTAVGSLVGWQVGVPLGSFRQDTFFEAARKADALDLAAVEGDSTQKVSAQIPKNLDYRLAPGEMDAVRDRMTSLNLRMPVYFTPAIGEDEQIARKVFEFAKSLGVETLAVEQTPKTWPAIEKLADEYGVNVALSGSPKTVLESLQGRSRRIGAYADLGKWMQEGYRAARRHRAAQRSVAGVQAERSKCAWQKRSDRCAGSGVAGIAPLLAGHLQAGVEARRSSPWTLAAGLMWSADLSRSLEGFEKAVQPVVAERVTQLSRGIPIKGPDRLTPEEREKITAAIPRKPAATPKASRRLLVYDANIGYGGANGGHRSIPAANMAIELFAKAPARTRRSSATISRISSTTGSRNSTRSS